MNTAIVIDTSREVPSKLYEIFNIYPLGYVIEDSKGNKYEERTKIQEIQTSKLLSVIKKDKKSKLLAPSIKDYVELYTYLAEEYKSLISIHSSLSTPAVFENAIVAKKIVSDVNIDIIDTQTLGTSSGIFIEELAKKIPESENINEIRKEAIRLDKKITSYILTRSDQLSNLRVGKIKKTSSLISSLKPYIFYQFSYGKWSEEGKNRSSKILVEEIKERVNEIKNIKEIKNFYYSSDREFSKGINPILKVFKNDNFEKITPSLVSYFLLGKESFNFSYF
jgi:fatty acid-binding protein DegV